MIRKAEAMETETRHNVRGGAGDVVFQHLFRQTEIKARTRLCARLTLPPGAGIGAHKHEGEDELFLVARGSGILDDGISRQRVKSGDAILTGNGEMHAIHNDGQEPLELIAIIMLY
jgi:mannose-6-phosphate isomerase-like protein (cupin superfamily)